MIRDPHLPGVEILQAHYVQHRYAPHWHEAVCVAVVSDGAASFDCGGQRHVAPAGSVFVIPAFEIHTGEPAADAGLGYRVLYASPGCVAQLLDDVAIGRQAVQPPRAARDVVRHRPAAAGQLLKFHQVMTGATAPLEREHALLAAVMTVARDFGLVPGIEPVMPEHRAVRRAREYLHAHPTEPVTLRDLAKVSGLSMYRLARTFRAQLGIPPHGYQVQLRVLRAKQLLAAGTPIAEAAPACGFYDQAHLTAQFKRHVGVTPGQYVRGANGRLGDDGEERS